MTREDGMFKALMLQEFCGAGGVRDYGLMPLRAIAGV